MAGPIGAASISWRNHRPPTPAAPPAIKDASTWNAARWNNQTSPSLFWFFFSFVSFSPLGFVSIPRTDFCRVVLFFVFFFFRVFCFRCLLGQTDDEDPLVRGRRTSTPPPPPPPPPPIDIDFASQSIDNGRFFVLSIRDDGAGLFLLVIFLFAPSFPSFAFS